MTKSLPPAGLRRFQEPSFQHQTYSTLFMSKSLSPSAQLTSPVTRYANDGSFNRREVLSPLVR